MASTPMTTQRLLTEAKERLKISQSKLAAILGITPTYVHEILHGKKEAKSRLFEFAEKLGVDLFDKENLQKKPIPVISWVHAGAFAECVDAWPPGVSGIEDPVFTTVKTGPNAFGLKVKGDSMTPMLLPGDIAIVDPAIRCDNGSPCVVWVNGEVSIKLFYDGEKEIRLVPANDMQPPTVIPKDSRVDFRVIGKVVAMERKF